jgi:hypothetical protein
MTKASALTALADRVEGASGPDRELDDAIYTAIVGGCLHTPVVKMVEVEPGEREPMTVCNKCFTTAVGVPRHCYTTSLDAALTLVPEGWFPWVGKNRGSTPEWSSDIRAPTGGYGVEADAATSALALTAAALRARAHLQSQDQTHVG